MAPLPGCSLLSGKGAELSLQPISAGWSLGLCFILFQWHKHKLNLLETSTF